MVVGITGGIGSGKSTVVAMFSKMKNVTVYIADAEAKKLMNTSETIKNSLIKEFGEKTYINNELNRAYLASIVFKDKHKLATLNAIVHPQVHQHLSNFIKDNNDKDYIVYENAILFENNSNQFCDKIVTVTAPLDIKIQRVIQRDGVTREDVLHRIKNQWSDEKKLLLSHYKIFNIDLAITNKDVLRIHNYLTKNNSFNTNIS
ncbi:Dephospho-CoA kinase [Tenacibaculum sp. 190130A14a]|uniref:Dephospho-CoA kinase n=1 Tax=Tenacibaculum polynesiense TaxID=3137857 RepID=A0ABP1EX51_9FLAO